MPFLLIPSKNRFRATMLSILVTFNSPTFGLSHRERRGNHTIPRRARSLALPLVPGYLSFTLDGRLLLSKDYHIIYRPSNDHDLATEPSRPRNHQHHPPRLCLQHAHRRFVIKKPHRLSRLGGNLILMSLLSLTLSSGKWWFWVDPPFGVPTKECTSNSRKDEKRAGRVDVAVRTLAVSECKCFERH